MLGGWHLETKSAVVWLGVGGILFLGTVSGTSLDKEVTNSLLSKRY